MGESGLPRLEESFELGPLLGEGGFGVVHRGRALQGGAEVAVKLSHAQLACDAETGARVLREARMMADIVHPRLARFLGLYQSPDDRLALVYQLVQGVTLSQRVAGGLPPPGLALEWIEQVAEALDVLHARDILHRDVKPQNIMIEPSETARLLDFGLARLEGTGSTLTATGIMVGTPVFMAPETLRGHPATRRSEVYALACLAYWLLEGDVPFPGESPGQQLARPLTTPPPGVRGVAGDRARALDRVFARGLAGDAAQRHGSAGAFAAGLRQALVAPTTPGERTRVVAPRPPSAGGRTPQRIEPRSDAWRAWRLATPGLLAAGIALALVHPGASPPPPGPTVTSPLPAATAEAPPPASVPGLDLASIEAALERWQADPAMGTALLDPLTWGKLRRSLPSIEAFQTWWRQPGRPDLPEALLDQMFALDERFLDEGLPRPFFPQIYLRPLRHRARPGRRTRALYQRFGVDPATVSPASGWLGLAFDELEGTLERVEGLQRDLDDGTSPLRPGKALEIMDANRLSLAADTGLNSGVGGRRKLAEVLHPAIESMHRFLVALAQAARAQPEHAEPIGVLAILAAGEDSLFPLYTSHLGSLEPEEVLGGPAPEGPGAVLFRSVLYQCYRLRDNALTARDPPPSLLPPSSDDWVRYAMAGTEPPAPGDEWGRLRFSMALSHATRPLHRVPDSALCLQVLARAAAHEPALRPRDAFWIARNTVRVLVQRERDGGAPEAAVLTAALTAPQLEFARRSLKLEHPSANHRSLEEARRVLVPWIDARLEAAR